jgi:hypothetical protein
MEKGEAYRHPVAADREDRSAAFKAWLATHEMTGWPVTLEEAWNAAWVAALSPKRAGE